MPARKKLGRTGMLTYVGSVDRFLYVFFFFFFFWGGAEDGFVTTLGTKAVGGHRLHFHNSPHFGNERLQLHDVHGSSVLGVEALDYGFHFAYHSIQFLCS